MVHIRCGDCFLFCFLSVCVWWWVVCLFVCVVVVGGGGGGGGGSGRLFVAGPPAPHLTPIT